MGKHRTLNLDKFVFAVPWDLFERYFARLADERQPNPWAFVNPDMMREFFDAPENAEAAGVITEEFRRINDACVNDGALLVQAARQHSLVIDDSCAWQATAMRFFLDHPRAFDFAWSLYLRLALSSRICEYHFPAGELKPTTEQVERFRERLRGWFANMSKGPQCQIACFEEGAGLLLRVSRGARMKTMARWREEVIDFETFRPASEEVIWYDPDASRLSIKATLKRDREQYITGIAEIFAENPDLAEIALNERIYTLEPFQTGDFNYRGDGIISHLRLVEVDLRLHGLTSPQLTVKSSNVVETLSGEVEGLSLRSGELTRVKLRADLRGEDSHRTQEVVFEIEPPGFSDIGQKGYARIVEAYLRQQHVKVN